MYSLLQACQRANGLGPGPDHKDHKIIRTKEVVSVTVNNMFLNFKVYSGDTAHKEFSAILYLPHDY